MIFQISTELWDEYEKDFEEITKIHSVEYSIFTTGGPTFLFIFTS